MSPFGAAPYVAAAGHLVELNIRKRSRIVPQRNIVTQKAREPGLVLQAEEITLAKSNGVDVIK
jgi:hypothetical protein